MQKVERIKEKEEDYENYEDEVTQLQQKAFRMVLIAIWVLSIAFVIFGLDDNIGWSKSGILAFFLLVNGFPYILALP